MSAAGRKRTGRYLLFLDVLGFTRLIETRGSAEIYSVINCALQAFAQSEEMFRRFRTIYFSDTFIFYQDPAGFDEGAFVEIQEIGGNVLSALLASGIPARGAISFGEFEVHHDETGKHQVYFGRALIEAYRAEQRESWIGIAILESAWAPYAKAKPGWIQTFANERAWIHRYDNVLLLNPFIEVRKWPALLHLRQSEMSSEMKSILEGSTVWKEILALKFLREQTRSYAERGDFTGPVASKYHMTMAFLRRILGHELYEIGKRVSEELMANPSINTDAAR